jgi:hypothetical protein
MPDPDDIKRQLALSHYWERKQKGLDVRQIPPCLDKESRVFYRAILKREEVSDSPTIKDLFRIVLPLP